MRLLRLNEKPNLFAPPLNGLIKSRLCARSGEMNDAPTSRVGTVLDQDQSTKPVMRTRTKVFLPLRIVVPAISRVT